MMGIWLAIAAILAVLAGSLARWRVTRTVSGKKPVVTDEVLRAVLEKGAVDLAEPDEPLDEKQIRRAEDDFWASEWEDPEPWQE